MRVALLGGVQGAVPAIRPVQHGDAARGLVRGGLAFGVQGGVEVDGDGGVELEGAVEAVREGPAAQWVRQAAHAMAGVRAREEEEEEQRGGKPHAFSQR